jgi:hypothetical protein
MCTFVLGFVFAIALIGLTPAALTTLRTRTALVAALAACNTTVLRLVVALAALLGAALASRLATMARLLRTRLTLVLASLL